MDTPTLQEVLTAAIDARTSEMRVAMPAVVVGYNHAEQWADVRPAVSAPGEEQPIVPHVPVLWPRGGTGYLLLPLAADDSGLLVCCDADIAEWRRTGEVGAPADDARHHLQSAVFIPGLVPTGHEVTSGGAGAAVLSADTVRLGDAAASKAAVHEDLLSDLNAFLGALTTWGALAHANWAAAAANFTANVAPQIATLVAGIAGGAYESSSVKVEA